MEEIREKKDVNLKKYYPYIAIGLAIIVLIILFTTIFGSPKKAVKNLAKGISKQNTSKVLNSIDLAGVQAWYHKNYNTSDFSKDDYEEFIDYYKDIDKRDIKEMKADLKDTLDDVFHKIKDNYKSFSVKVEKINSKKKLGKKLYAVDAKISLLAKPKDKKKGNVDVSASFVFIVYNNKVIGVDLTNYTNVVKQIVSAL